jgi:hypothetical protein
MTQTDATVMLSRILQRPGHTRRFVIARTEEPGWEVREEEDSRIVRTARYTDWHRVERARSIIDLRVSTLAAEGWVEL